MKYNVDSDGLAILNFDVPDSPVNVWNLGSIAKFNEVVDQFIADDKARGLLITSEKNPFCAGADLKSLQPLSDVEKNMEIVGQLVSSFRKLEKTTKPVVAGISGTVLGGGYELCLACNHRIALDNPKIRIGLPEVTIGLLPGAGGTQRLPRLIGIQASSSFLLEGKKLDPERALKAGLVDELANSAEALVAKAKVWIDSNPEVSQPWDQKGFKIPGGPVLHPKNYMLFTAGNALLTQKSYNNYPAPQAIMACLYEGLQLDFDTGMKVESRYFRHLLTTPEAEHMIRTLFFGMTALGNGSKRPKDIPKSQPKKVGVLGAGMMGAGIAYAAANVGIEVVLKDVNQEAAEKGKSYTAKVLSKKVKRGQMTEAQVQEKLNLIKATDKAEDLAGVDLIIEAVTENRELKEKVIKEAESVLVEGTLISSNTSTLPITGLSEFSRNPENFIGLHFFSPVDKMPLVEIIMGKGTSQEALAKSLDFVMALKKTPIVVNDGRGFFTSRVFGTYVNEGMALLKEGVAPALIENAGRMAGMPVGPLAVADEVSIDLVRHVLVQTAKDLGTELDSPAAIVSEVLVVKNKRLGRKSGGGFYDYHEDGTKSLWPELAQLFPLKKEQPSVEEVQKRLLYVQALDAARAFEEGVVTDATQGDVGSILGIGFPPFTGGVYSYMDHIGAEKIVSDCAELEKKYGAAFHAPKILVDMAKNGKRFH